ncbi:MAG: hypothetical protein ACFFG0_57210 [Candidatus Thorarchaeota archaeon]
MIVNSLKGYTLTILDNLLNKHKIISINHPKVNLLLRTIPKRYLVELWEVLIGLLPEELRPFFPYFTELPDGRIIFYDRVIYSLDTLRYIKQTYEEDKAALELMRGNGSDDY